MKTRAAIDAAYGAPIVVEEIQIPDPAVDEVVVKMISSGVCHSQLTLYIRRGAVGPRFSATKARASSRM